MQRFCTAMMTRWNTSTGSTIRNLMADPTKGLWFELAPHNTKRPFIVYRVIASTVIGTMVTTGIDGMNYDTNVDVGISVDPYQLDAAMNIAREWKILFDNQLLTLSSGRMIYARRTGDGTITTDLDAGIILTLPYRYIYTDEQ